MAKRYGLIIPGQKSEVTQPKADFTKPSIFGDDTDDDDYGPPTKSTTVRVPMGPGNSEQRQARKLHEKALEEDPTVFQYDELYDAIESKRQEEKNAKSKEVKKPRYIGRLLECAERRKIEYERRIERMAQKEREAEGDQFKDKESFVTSAYRKKLEELKKAEEREKREDYLEAIGDVTKQQDLGGFYRHLYEQKLGPKTVPEAQNKKSPSPVENSSGKKEADKLEKIKATKSRAYRKRRASEDEDDQENIPQKAEVATKKSHLQSNLDADSDFSIDSSSDSEEEGTDKIPTESETQVNPEKVVVKKEPEEEVTEKSKENGEEQPEVDTTKVKVEKDEVEPKKEEEKKVKKDIWKKRTVGKVFDDALQRYFERKAARNG